MQLAICTSTISFIWIWNPRIFSFGTCRNRDYHPADKCWWSYPISVSVEFYHRSVGCSRETFHSDASVFQEPRVSLARKVGTCSSCVVESFLFFSRLYCSRNRSFYWRWIVYRKGSFLTSQLDKENSWIVYLSFDSLGWYFFVCHADVRMSIVESSVQSK